MSSTLLAEPFAAVHGDGLLELAFRRGPGGLTGLAARKQRFPLRITVPLELDPAVPGMQFVYVQNPTGGVFAGDRLCTRIDAGPGTRVHLTTPAATRIFAMTDGHAEQTLELAVGEGAYVESVPEPLVPHAGSRLRQRTLVALADGACLVVADILSPGRLARGEAFAYRRVELETLVSDRDGTELCADRIVLEPARRAPSSNGVLGGGSHLGTLLALGRDAPALARTIDARIAHLPAAAGELPAGVGVLIRAIGTAAETRQAIEIAWACARELWLGAPLPPRRK